jgi:hypothetical protein
VQRRLPPKQSAPRLGIMGRNHSSGEGDVGEVFPVGVEFRIWRIRRS